MSDAEMLPMMPLRRTESAGTRPAYASVVPASASTTSKSTPSRAIQSRAAPALVESSSMSAPLTRARSYSLSSRTPRMSWP
ncbi:MAG TPA: hypothetical protein VIL68_15185 [Propionibacteriaceae bacterium]